MEDGVVATGSPGGASGGIAGRRIVVADADVAVCRFYETFLVAGGHQVCVARTGWQLVELCRLLHPDLLLCAVDLPDLDGITAVTEICRFKPVPVILVSTQPDPGLVERFPHGVLASLVKPVQEKELATAIALVVRQFEQLRSLQQKVLDLQQALEERKLIERAKGVVMKHTGLDEQEAFRRLTKLATDSNRKLVAVATVVLEAGDLFRQLEQMGDSRKPGYPEPVRDGVARRRPRLAPGPAPEAS